MRFLVEITKLKFNAWVPIARIIQSTELDMANLKISPTSTTGKSHFVKFNAHQSCLPYAIQYHTNSDFSPELLPLHVLLRKINNLKQGPGSRMEESDRGKDRG